MIEEETKLLDIRKILILLYRRKRLLIILVVISTSLGVFTALNADVEFESNAVLIQEKTSMGLDMGSSGLLKQFGFSAPNLSKESIQPVTYEYIFNSVTFQKAMINSYLDFENGDSIRFSNYFERDSEQSFWKSFFFWKGKNEIPNRIIKKDYFLMLSNEETMIEELRQRLTINVDEVTGVVFIKAKMPDRYAAASLVINARNELNRKIITFSTTRSERNLQFIKKELEKISTSYFAKQKELSDFLTANRYITDELLKFKQTNLELEYDLLSEMFLGLNQQKIQAEIELNKDKNSFLTLRPPVVPIEKSEPKRKRIVLLSVILAFLAHAFIVFILYARSAMKKHVQSFIEEASS